MESTDAQKQTLEDFEKSEMAGKARFKVVGCDPRTGCIKMRAEETFVVLPNGLAHARPAS